MRSCTNTDDMHHTDRQTADKNRETETIRTETVSQTWFEQ